MKPVNDRMSLSRYKENTRTNLVCDLAEYIPNWGTYSPPLMTASGAESPG
jgi:hypothetical protein